MKRLFPWLVLFFLFSELHAQTFSAYPVIIKLNYNQRTQKEGLSNISIGLGIAKAFRYKDDEFSRNNNTRFLFNMNVTARIYHPLYLNMGFEYNKADLRGYEDYYNLAISPSFGGRAFGKKVTYFIEAGPNFVLAFRNGRGEGMLLGLSAGLRCQYNITEKYSVGVNFKHINYFDVISENYFIVHSNLYFSVKI